MGFKRRAVVLNGSDPSELETYDRPQKKIRAFTEEDVQLAKIFDKLASDDDQERLTSSAELVKICLSLYTDGRGAEGEPSELSARAEKVETRLLRGLCSDRKSARIGFAAVLTEVLRIKLRSTVTSGGPLEDDVNKFLEQVEAATRREQGSSSQDKRNYVLGKIFGLKSLVESQALVHGKKNKGVAAMRLFDVLCTIIQQADSAWIAEECGLVGCQLIRSLTEQITKSNPANAWLDIISSKGLSKTREGIALWVDVQRHFPDIPPTNIWYQHDPLLKKELPTLVKALHGINPENGLKDLSGTRQQRPHFAWYTVLHAIVDRDLKAEEHSCNKSKMERVFPRFWLEAVDNVFFAPTASAEKKAIGFQLFADVLGFAPRPAIAAAFSPKLMTCLINQSAQADRYLHTVAKTLLETIVQTARTRSEVAPMIFISLISGHGNIDFDKLTKSKTTFDIMTVSEQSALETMLDHYGKLLTSPMTNKQETADAIRGKIADQLVLLVKHHPNAAETSSALVVQPLDTYYVILKMLAMLGLQTNRKLDALYSMKYKFSPATQEMLRSKLMLCLTYLTAKYPKHCTTILNGVLDQFVDEERRYDSTTENIRAFTKMAEDVRDDIRETHTTVYADEILPRLQNSKKEAPEVKSRIYGMTILFSLALLQAYSGEDEAGENALQIGAVCEQLMKGSFEFDETTMASTFEVLLNFVSQESALSRQLSEQVFNLLIPDLDDSCVEMMTEVLEAKEGLAGQQELFGQDESGDEAEGSAVEGEEDSDVEQVENEDEDDDEDEEEEEGEDGDSDDGEDEDEDDEEEHGEGDNLDDIIARLSTNPKVQRQMPDGSFESEDEDEMDDDVMLARDEIIANVIRLQNKSTIAGRAATNSKKQNTNRAAKQNVLTFKNRIVSLLTLWLKQQHSSEDALALILPLLQLIRTTRNSQLASRASALLLNTYFPIAKKKGLPLDADVDHVLELLEQCYEETRLWASREHVKVGSRACLFLARVALALGEGEDEKAKGKKAKKGKKGPEQGWKWVVEMLDERYKEGRAMGKGKGTRPEWQDMLWKDWEEFRRHVVESKEADMQVKGSGDEKAKEGAAAETPKKNLAAEMAKKSPTTKGTKAAAEKVKAGKNLQAIEAEDNKKAKKATVSNKRKR